MPSMRSLDTGTSFELLSSKTFIGSGATTCDLVILGDNILDLHALINLSSDKTYAKLVPFSTTDVGICYLNAVVVPRDGAVVVHGDRMAFGNPRNIFLFELNSHPPAEVLVSPKLLATAHSKQHSSAQTLATTSNHKAQDALGGDRIMTRSTIASIPDNLPLASRQARNNILSSVSPVPMGQLSKFLIEASSDSLLSDYIERKLKQRRSTTVMNQSEHTGSKNVYSGKHNLVLNKKMELKDDNISPSKLSKSKILNRTDNKKSHLSLLPSVEDINSNRSEEEDEEDELPDMMEKASGPPTNLSFSIETEHSEQSSMTHSPNEAQQELDDISLKSRSGQSHKPSQTQSFFLKAMGLGLNDLTRSHPRSIKIKREETPKIHQTIVSETIRQKRNEILSKLIISWKQGLQKQRENRDLKARKIEEVRSVLRRLHHAHQFFRWRDYTAIRSQVVTCRFEAFQQRYAASLVRKCWIALYLHHLSTKRRLTQLRGLVIMKESKAKHFAFHRWEVFVQKCSVKNELSQTKRVHRRNLDVYLERNSKRYNQTKIQPRLIQILWKWKKATEQRKKQQQMLRKLFIHQNIELIKRALRKWITFALIVQFRLDMEAQMEQRVQQVTERLTSEHNKVQSSTVASHARQLEKLTVEIKERNQELERKEQDRRLQAFEKAAAETKREQDLQTYFENAIVKCDEHITLASDQLETLLLHAENDVLSARFGASQLLVDCLLRQKISNTNEYIHLQETYRTTLSSDEALKSLSYSDLISNLSTNCRFLYDMIQQRLARLQQLHQSLAKLAAVSVVSCNSLDPDRLYHSSFIACSLFQRQQTHLEAVIRQFRCLGHQHIKFSRLEVQ